MLDANLQQALALIQLVDIRLRLGRGLAYLHQVLQNLIDFGDYLAVLLIELEKLDEQLQLVLVYVDDLHLVGDDVLGLLLAVFLYLVHDELLLHLLGHLQQFVHVEQDHFDYCHGRRVDVHVLVTVALSFRLLRGRRGISGEL